MRADAVIEVRFLQSEEGGRESKVEGEFYACPLLVGSDAFDCRVFLGGKVLDLGASYRLEVAFLDRERALLSLPEGKAFQLWEGKIIATGYVVKHLKH